MSRSWLSVSSEFVRVSLVEGEYSAPSPFLPIQCIYPFVMTFNFVFAVFVINYHCYFCH